MPVQALISILLVLSSLCVFAQPGPPPRERHFVFNYTFTVKEVKPGERVRIWIPLAQSDEYQDVRVLAKSGDLPLKEVRQPEFGNVILYAESAKADKNEYAFAVKYDVVRREHLVLAYGKPISDKPPAQEARAGVARFLQADRLVPVTGVPAQLAEQQTKGANNQLEKAKDIYEYVFRTMKYDKSGAGWGHGDTLWACDSKRGNCTDFHSVFISMARAENIPARFEIGFPIPTDKHSAEIPGYHCWAEFFLDSTGWVPIDISEAWKHPEKHDYFFGAHDVNRVQFSEGRDLRLKPKQDGQPLNYFVYPYVEEAGQEHSNVSIAFSFQDVESTSGSRLF